jgi:hypothetical protein
MDDLYNEKVTLTGIITEMIPKIRKLSLCIRVRAGRYDHDEEVVLDVYLDGFKPNTREFLGLSQIILSHTCSRKLMLTITSGDLITRAQAILTEQSMKVEERIGVEGCKRLVGMVESARAFVLAALLIS